MYRQVNWQTVVGELKKESHAFDMLVDVLITFALDPDIFRQFGQEFTGLFRQFKSLNLSLVSDQGFVCFRVFMVLKVIYRYLIPIV